MTSRVSGGEYGGGIVGHANGYVTNNTFEYGITLLQNKETHKNIVGVKNSYHTFKSENNAWPTVDTNLDLTNATATENLYDGIIDSEAEIVESEKATYNIGGKRYRLAQDITVTTKTGSIAYELDGNNKQITTEAMIFDAITGQVHDLTIYVKKDLIATPLDAATDAIAPLAFEVHGQNAVINNIKVKMAEGTRIQAANPAGVVVWAWGDATISNCEAKANIQAWVANPTTNQGRKYAGGIVSSVSRATVTQCVFHSITDNNTLTQNRNSSYDNTGTANALAEANIIYYGGIVGGIEPRANSGETPELTITDCTSFVTVVNDKYHGGILGYSLYGTNTATKDCQGNWWSSDCSGVGTFIGSVEATIGKRNAITPSEKEY